MGYCNVYNFMWDLCGIVSVLCDIEMWDKCGIWEKSIKKFNVGYMWDRYVGYHVKYVGYMWDLYLPLIKTFTFLYGVVLLLY